MKQFADEMASAELRRNRRNWRALAVALGAHFALAAHRPNSPLIVTVMRLYLS